MTRLQPMSSVPTSSYVHHLEANEQLDVQASNNRRNRDNERAVSFRHSGFSRERRWVISALEETGESVEVVQRVKDCGKFASVLESVEPLPRYKIRCDRCHHRFCAACSKERSRVIANNVEKKVRGMRTRFLTLTLKHRQEEVSKTVARLLQSFKELRRSRLWKRAVDGGIGFVEVKVSDGWHVHLHALITGNFLDYKELRKLWLKITGDSFVIDIRTVKDQKEVIYYVAKYASKSLDRSTMFHRSRFLELVRGLKGKRLLLTFGDWRGWRVESDKDETEWIRIDALSAILRKADDGDLAAIRIVRILNRAYSAAFDSNEFG